MRWSTLNCWNVDNGEHHGQQSDWRAKTCWEWQTVDVGMMQYSVYVALGVSLRSLHGQMERDDLASWS